MSCVASPVEPEEQPAHDPARRRAVSATGHLSSLVVHGPPSGAWARMPVAARSVRDHPRLVYESASSALLRKRARCLRKGAAAFASLALGSACGGAPPGGSDAGADAAESIEAAVLDAASGCLTSSEHLAASPGVYHFVGVLVGSSSRADDVRVMDVAASATATITTDIVGPDATLFAIDASTCDGVPLAPGAACVVVVRFTPVAATPAVALLEVHAGAERVCVVLDAEP